MLPHFVDICGKVPQECPMRSYDLESVLSYSKSRLPREISSASKIFSTVSKVRLRFLFYYEADSGPA